MDLNSLNFTLTSEALLLVPVIVGVVQMLKWMPVITKYKDYLPFISLGLGVLFAYTSHISNPVMAGIVMGLAATGSYEAIKE